MHDNTELTKIVSIVFEATHTFQHIYRGGQMRTKLDENSDICRLNRYGWIAFFLLEEPRNVQRTSFLFRPYISKNLKAIEEGKTVFPFFSLQHFVLIYTIRQSWNELEKCSLDTNTWSKHVL